MTMANRTSRDFGTANMNCHHCGAFFNKKLYLWKHLELMWYQKDKTHRAKPKNDVDLESRSLKNKGVFGVKLMRQMVSLRVNSDWTTFVKNQEASLFVDKLLKSQVLNYKPGDSCGVLILFKKEKDLDSIAQKMESILVSLMEATVGKDCHLDATYGFQIGATKRMAAKYLSLKATRLSDANKVKEAIKKIKTQFWFCHLYPCDDGKRSKNFWRNSNTEGSFGPLETYDRWKFKNVKLIIMSDCKSLHFNATSYASHHLVNVDIVHADF